jgi:hypothetical protein
MSGQSKRQLRIFLENIAWESLLLSIGIVVYEIYVLYISPGTTRVPPGAVFFEQEVKRPQKQVKNKPEIESITSQLKEADFTNKKIDDKRSTQVDVRTKKVRKLKKSLRQIE